MVSSWLVPHRFTKEFNQFVRFNGKKEDHFLSFLSFFKSTNLLKMEIKKFLKIFKIS